MAITHLKSKANELLDQNPNWSVGVSIKEVAGATTGQNSVTLFVEKKKPLEEIDEADRFPSSVTIDGVVYPTDVVEQGKAVLIGWPRPPYPGQNFCYESVEDGAGAGYFVNPLSANNSVRRPLIGGIVCQSLPPGGYDGSWKSSGTLGGLVVDNTDNTICGLTNMHVVHATPMSSVSQKGSSHFISDTGYTTYFSYLCCGAIYYDGLVDAPVAFGNNGSIELTENIGNYPMYQMKRTQNNSVDEAFTATWKIGSVKRSSLYETGFRAPGTNGMRIDSALITIEPTNCKSTQDGNSVNYHQIVAGESPEGTYEGTINGVDYGMEFATGDEIERLLDTNFHTDETGKVPETRDGTVGPLLFKSGARTGPVGSPGTLASYPPGQADWCNMKLSAFAIAPTNTSYDIDSSSVVYDCIFVRGTTIPAAGGDSGSLLCGRIPVSVDEGPPWDGTVTYTEYKIIGHVFAAFQGYWDDEYELGSELVAARIDNIAEDLDIRAYRGAGTLEFATLENKQTRITTGYSSDLTMTYNGKKYWQAGKTNGPAEDV